MTNITITATICPQIPRAQPVDKKAWLAGFRGERAPVGGSLEDFAYGCDAARTLIRLATVDFAQEALETAKTA